MTEKAEDFRAHADAALREVQAVIPVLRKYLDRSEKFAVRVVEAIEARERLTDEVIAHRAAGDLDAENQAQAELDTAKELIATAYRTWNLLQDQLAAASNRYGGKGAGVVRMAKDYLEETIVVPARAQLAAAELEVAEKLTEIRNSFRVPEEITVRRAAFDRAVRASEAASIGGRTAEQQAHSYELSTEAMATVYLREIERCASSPT